MCEKIVLHIECPGDGCKAVFGCPDCEGTAEDSCATCKGSGHDPDHSGDCFLTADGGAKEYGYLEEFYEGTCARLSDGAKIEWYATYDEWGWKLVEEVKPWRPGE